MLRVEIIAKDVRDQHGEPLRKGDKVYMPDALANRLIAQGRAVLAMSRAPSLKKIVRPTQTKDR